LALNENHEWLFAVNAGSNSVSSFKVNSNGGLTLAHTASSGGIMPISLSVHDHLLYVVNAGSSDILGYKVSSDGSLTPITGSHQKLSAVNAGPAQISFSPGDHSLLVTEKNTNKITAFAVHTDGSAGAGVSTPSVGQTPFGFDFSRNQFMIVSNAAGGALNASSCTSYENLYLHPMDVNGAVPDHQTAACWVATTKFGRLAYVANTGSNTISSYYISFSGKLYFIPWANTPTGKAPADLIVSADNYYVYNINGTSHTLGEFKRAVLGTLNNIGHVSSIPEFAAGMVAY